MFWKDVYRNNISLGEIWTKVKLRFILCFWRGRGQGAWAEGDVGGWILGPWGLKVAEFLGRTPAVPYREIMNPTKAPKTKLKLGQTKSYQILDHRCVLWRAWQGLPPQHRVEKLHSGIWELRTCIQALPFGSCMYALKQSSQVPWDSVFSTLKWGITICLSVKYFR